MGRVFSTYADDRIGIELIHDDLIHGQLEIDWCDTTKRKSVIEFHVNFEHANVRADNSTVEIESHFESSLSPDSLAQIDMPVQPRNVGYYLRGEEFSLELEEFLSKGLGLRLSVDKALPTDITPLLKDGCEVDRLIDEIARKAGLK
jgi:hypothetical protein